MKINFLKNPILKLKYLSHIDFFFTRQSFMAKAIISKKFKEGLIDKVIFNSVSIKKKKKTSNGIVIVFQNTFWERNRFKTIVRYTV